MSLNFKTYKDENPNGPGGDFESLPEGRYDVEADQADLKTAESGNDYIKVRFTVISEKYKNRKLWTNFTLVPSAMGFLFSFMESAGSTLLDQDGVEAKTVTAALPGMRANAFVVPDKFGDKASNKISGYKPVEGSYDTVAKASSEAPAKESDGSALWG